MESTQTLPTEAGAPDGDEPRVRVAGPVYLAFRSVITVHALDAFAQAVLAGGFLNGDYELLGLHRDNAVMGVIILGYLQLLIAVLYWRPGGGRIWPMLACVGISAAEGLQVRFGFARMIGVHVPLGVAIIASMALLVTWAWRGTFGQRRRAPARSTS